MVMVLVEQPEFKQYARKTNCTRGYVPCLQIGSAKKKERPTNQQLWNAWVVDDASEYSLGNVFALHCIHTHRKGNSLPKSSGAVFPKPFKWIIKWIKFPTIEKKMCLC